MFVSYEQIEEKPVKERHSPAGPGWFIMDIDYVVKKKPFLYPNLYRKKISSFQDSALLESFIYLCKEALKCKFAAAEILLLINITLPIRQGKHTI